jgi:TatD DNase family protein
MLIDTHCHLYLSDFQSDFDTVLNNALKNDVRKIILPNIDVESLPNLQKTYEKNTYIFAPTLGLHPTSVKENFNDELTIIFSSSFDNVVAIGEIGIDLYWDKTFLAEQKSAFEFQINVAVEKSLPVIIHSRNSMNEIFDVLKLYKNKNLRGVFHCFPGSVQQAKQVVDNGFYIGIGGVVTYKNSGMQNVVRELPLEHMVLETDAPFLTPAPHRGTRNEPSYIKIIAEKIAEIKNISLDEITEITTKNAELLFLSTSSISFR